MKEGGRGSKRGMGSAFLSFDAGIRGRFVLSHTTPTTSRPLRLTWTKVPGVGIDESEKA